MPRCRPRSPWDEARTADGKGDAQACNAAVERAKNQLAKAP